MSTLLKYLLSAKGERGLLGKIGQWRLRVSQTLDQVNQTLSSLVQTVNASGLGAPLYITTRNDAEQPVAAPADLVLDDIVNNTGITYDTVTGEYTLAAGTYEMEFYGQFQSFAAVNASVVVEWVNALNAPLVLGTESRYFAVAGTSDASSKPVAKVIYQTLVPVVVKIRATQAPNGGATLSVDSYAIVRKIG